MAAPADRPILAYVPRASRGLRWIPLAFASAILIGLGVAIHQWGPAIWDQANYLRIQRRSMTHSLPVGTVVFDNDRQAAANLLRDPTRYRTVSPFGGIRPTFTYLPAEYFFPDLIWKPALFGNSTNPGDSVVFLHSRKTKDGTERLIAVVLDSAHFDDDSSEIDACTYTLKPGTWEFGSRVQLEKSYSVPVLGYHYKASQRVTIYAGQMDPNDESHWSFVFQIEDRRTTMEFWLEDPTAQSGDTTPWLETSFRSIENAPLPTK